MLRKWRTYRSLSQPKRYAIRSALILLPLARLSIASAGLEKTRKRFASIPFPLIRKFSPTPNPVDIAAMTASAASLLKFRSHCLPSSIVTCHILTKLGIDSQLRIGTAPDNAEGITAHAWVECNGISLDTDSDRIAEFRVFSDSDFSPTSSSK